MLKEAYETAKTIKNALDTVGKLKQDIEHLKAIGETSSKTLEVTQIAIQLQGLVLSLQSDLLTLQSAKADLEAEISQLRKFEIEKDEYSPFQFPTGAFVYRSNKGIANANGEIVFHYLCANCFNAGRKSILQPSAVEGYFEMLTCHHCSAKYQYKRIEMAAAVVRTRSRRWDGY
ncbi:hypothetical protein ACLSZN_02480 [Avibacterium avium]|uniref:hypothetical protein n=1 Tax=Avibacterium avium TaxID=751 RepID=UPI003BF7CEF4